MIINKGENGYQLESYNGKNVGKKIFLTPKEFSNAQLLGETVQFAMGETSVFPKNIGLFEKDHRR